MRPAERDVLVLSQPDATLGDYLHSVTFAQSHELISPTLPIRAAVASFFAGSPDETV